MLPIQKIGHQGIRGPKVVEKSAADRRCELIYKWGGENCQVQDDPQEKSEIILDLLEGKFVFYLRRIRTKI